MGCNYDAMDEWSDEQVAEFKELKTEDSLEDVHIQSKGFRPTREIVVAEGDSWFDYLPGTDLIDCLSNHHGYKIKNTANAGDTLENMIYGTGFNDQYQRTYPSIKTVLKQLEKYKPRIFLFSGGGNDIAGDEFASFLNHKESSLPELRTEYVNDMVNTVFRNYFEDLIEKVHSKSPETQIITHGYGHTVPTGKGVKFLFFTFAGPWLRPALATKGIFNPEEQFQIVETMINVYNTMLLQLDSKHDNFHHVDLRQIIDPQKDWSNELHLKNSAFARVAELIHHRIQTISTLHS